MTKILFVIGWIVVLYSIGGIIIATMCKVFLSRQFKDVSWFELVLKWPGLFGLFFE